MRAKRGRLPPISPEQLSRPEQKRAYMRHLFAVVAPSYDAATRRLSFWSDQRWKRLMVEALPPAEELPSPAALAALDLACGTGDLCFALAERYPSATITGLDLAEEMLVIARRRAAAGGRPSIRFINGDMAHLPFPAESVHLVTGGYALRNAPDLQQALLEVYRVLRPGGSATFLDFSAPDFRPTRAVRLFLLTVWGRIWGRVLHRDPEVYAYISRSLRHYPSDSALIQLMGRMGFADIVSRSLFGGFVSIIWMRKPHLPQ